MRWVLIGDLVNMFLMTTLFGLMAEQALVGQANWPLMGISLSGAALSANLIYSRARRGADTAVAIDGR